MTQIDAPAAAQVNARSCTGALPWNAARGIIPFLMVEAVLAPTASAPVISNTKHKSWSRSASVLSIDDLSVSIP